MATTARRILLITVAAAVLAACVPPQLAVHLDHGGTPSCVRLFRPDPLCDDGEDIVVTTMADDRSDGLIPVGTLIPGLTLVFSLSAGTTFRMIGAPASNGTCFDADLGSEAGGRLEGEPFLGTCVWGPATAPPGGEVHARFDWSGLPPSIRAVISISRTQGCLDYTTSPYLCAIGLDASLPVLDDDRSDGLVVIGTYVGGRVLSYSVEPGTSHRLMGPQRSDGTCADVTVNGVAHTGAPFLAACVWGPVVPNTLGSVSITTASTP